MNRRFITPMTAIDWILVVATLWGPLFTFYSGAAGLGGNDIQKLTSALRGSKNGVVRVWGAALWVLIDSQNRWVVTFGGMTGLLVYRLAGS